MTVFKTKMAETLEALFVLLSMQSFKLEHSFEMSNYVMPDAVLLHTSTDWILSPSAKCQSYSLQLCALYSSPLLS